MPITIQNSAGGGVTLDSTTSSNETLQLPSGGGTLAPLASPVFTGNVGIGVTPESHHSTHTSLQVGGTGNWTTGTTQGASQEMDFQQNAYYAASGNDKYIVTDEASKYRQGGGAHYFKVAPSGTADAAISWTTAMKITNNGVITVGTDTPFSSGIVCFDGGNNAYVPLVTRVTQTANATQIGFVNGNGNIGSITSNGSSTAYNTSSDYRLKENVTPMSGATAQTKLLKPCNFDWITGGNVNGFIAHELAEVVPEAVTGTKDAMRDEEYEVTPAVLDDEGNETTAAVMGTRSVPDMQGIDQSKLVPLLTATIQELIARIEALENV